MTNIVSISVHRDLSSHFVGPDWNQFCHLRARMYLKHEQHVSIATSMRNHDLIPCVNYHLLQVHQNESSRNSPHFRSVILYIVVCLVAALGKGADSSHSNLSNLSQTTKLDVFLLVLLFIFLRWPQFNIIYYIQCLCSWHRDSRARIKEFK